MTQIEVDRLDMKILSMVQKNNLLPHREVAESVGLSTPAVTRRLQRLRKQGLIKADVAILNAAELGRPLTIIVKVVADSEKITDLDALRGGFNRCPQIQHCYYVTGEADFILILNVADMGEYEKLTRQLFFESGNVRHFTTFVSMETIKANSHIIV